MGPGVDVPDDYFFINASAQSVMLRQKILKKCREDIYAWLNHENGQVAIYDAVNPLSGGRRSLAKEFAKHDVQVSKKRCTWGSRKKTLKADAASRHFSLSRMSLMRRFFKRTRAVSRSRLRM